jgi:hypothetical protein
VTDFRFFIKVITTTPYLHRYIIERCSADREICMREEFKYIPYDPKDTNLRGLIDEGYVFNLNRFQKGMGGLFLPENEAMDIVADMQYMKNMYPAEFAPLCAAVEEECDKLEYEGSPMLVEYPDRETMRKVARGIYEKMQEQGIETWDFEKDINKPSQGNTPVGSIMRQVIELMVCNEFCVRRDRHRRRIRRFYQ